MELIKQSHNNKLISNIAIAFVLVGLNAAFIGGSYYKITQAQALSLSNTNNLNHLSSLANKVHLDISEVNDYIKNSESHNKVGNLASIKEKSSAINKNLSEIKALMRSDDDKIMIGNLEEITTRYQYNFQTSLKVSTELGATEKSSELTQFTNRIKEISAIVANAKDEKLTEKYIALQNLQENYLNFKGDVTPEQVIVAQKNFLDRVNRSSADYAVTSKMMVQTISLMQSFELLKNSIEGKKFLLKRVETDRLLLQDSLKQLSIINDTYKDQDEKQVQETEKEKFILFLVSMLLVIVSFAIAWFLLNRSTEKQEETISLDDANHLQKIDV